MTTTCPTCGKEVQVTKHNKLAPHNHTTPQGVVRCPGSGKRLKKEKQ